MSCAVASSYSRDGKKADKFDPNYLGGPLQTTTIPVEFMLVDYDKSANNNRIT